MSFVRFDIIAKVVELGSFTAAAEALKYDAVSCQSCSGECRVRVGVSLFIRDRKRALC